MNKKGRKSCICSRCNKEKLHFGKGMCSACLRRTKRETKPLFYLGTCYSEMSRRVKTYDPLRPNYFGKAICTKEEFIERFLKDNEFLKLYRKWQRNNFQRKFAPSIDRFDNSLGYEINNLRFITHAENTGKDFRNKISVDNGTYFICFESQRATAKFLKMHTSTLCIKLKKGECEINGWKITRI